MHFKSIIRPTNLLIAITLLSIVINVYHLLPKIQVEFPIKEINSSVFKQPSLEDSVVKHSITIEKGDTIIKVFNSLGVDGKAIQLINQELNNLEKGFFLNVGDKISVGPIKQIDFDDSGEVNLPLDVELIKGGRIYDLSFEGQEKKYIGKTCSVPMQTHTKFVSGKVQGSIFSAARIKGVDTNTIMSFINVYSFMVDFQRDIRAGDEFQIYYEYKVDPSTNKAKDSKILYASLSTGGKSKVIYRHELKDGRVDYFDEKGQSVKRALLKTPVNGARISGRYGWRAKHPVLGYSRMHKGIDYAAPTGTPIFAAGDGVVSFVKSQRRGYGKHIQIRHNSTYSTLYAHMSRFAKGVRPGSRVTQGQIVGYIGATGLASGPHLHYEVKVRGKQVNPAKVDFIKSKPLKAQELEAFKKNVALYNVIVENAQSTTKVANVH